MRLRHFVVRVTLLCSVFALAASQALAAHLSPLLPLTSGSNHSHENFSGMAFPAANLSFIDLSFADLSNCTFAPGTNLTGARFMGAKMTNMTIAGCILDNADFRGADLTNSVVGCANNADFRGAIVTGVLWQGCACVIPNIVDNCTTGGLGMPCAATANFRGVIAGVVFSDLNQNGTLEFGEPGIPGVTVVVSDQLGNTPILTDGRGAYRYVSTFAAGANVTLQVGTLPAGTNPTSATAYAPNLAVCRSGQNLNFGAIDLATPTATSSFGRLKILYR